MRAGDIAMRFWGRSPRHWDKGDQGPVSEADIAVNDMLATMLRAARPDYGWLSEETPDDAARLDCDSVFIVDPIDGTRAFIDGDRNFSHSLAVADQGLITAAVVFVPAVDRLYTATESAAAQCNGWPIRCTARTAVEGASLLTSKPNLTTEHWTAGPPPVNRAFRASIAYRMCLVADGSFDAALSLRPTWEWDVAAGSLIARRAGAMVSDRQRQPLQFNAADPRVDGVLAAPAGLHAGLGGMLHP